MEENYNLNDDEVNFLIECVQGYVGLMDPEDKVKCSKITFDVLERLNLR